MKKEYWRVEAALTPARHAEDDQGLKSFSRVTDVYQRGVEVGAAADDGIKIQDYGCSGCVENGMAVRNFSEGQGNFGIRERTAGQTRIHGQDASAS